MEARVWWYCDKSTCEHPHEWQSAPNTRIGQDTLDAHTVREIKQHSARVIASPATHPSNWLEQLHPDEPIDPATELTAWF